MPFGRLALLCMKRRAYQTAANENIANKVYLLGIEYFAVLKRKHAQTHNVHEVSITRTVVDFFFI